MQGLLWSHQPFPRECSRSVPPAQGLAAPFHLGFLAEPAATLHLGGGDTSRGRSWGPKRKNTLQNEVYTQPWLEMLRREAPSSGAVSLCISFSAIKSTHVPVSEMSRASLQPAMAQTSGELSFDLGCFLTLSFISLCCSR